MIGIFLGEQNSGKTLSMSAYALDYFRNGYKIYSNFNLNFKCTKITKDMIKEYVEQKKQFNKAVFCIDELHILFDARNFPSMQNKFFSYFLTQTSKRDVHLIGTTQSFEMVERRFRKQCNFKIFCERVLKIGNKYMEVKQMLRFLDKQYNKILYIRNSFVIKRIIGIQETYQYKTVYIKADKIFKLFDTKQLLDIN